MLMQFKQAVCIHGKDYSKGTHEVPEKSLKHPFFLKMIKAGLIIEAPVSQPISPVSFQDKQRMLAEKIMGQDKKAAVKKADEPIKEEQEVPAEEIPILPDPSFSEAKEEKKGKPKKKGR